MKLNRIISLVLTVSMLTAALFVPSVLATEGEENTDSRVIYEDNFDKYTGFSAETAQFVVGENIFREDSEFVAESKYCKFEILTDEDDENNKFLRLDSCYTKIGAQSGYLLSNMEYLSDEALLTKENQMEKGSMKLSFSFRIDGVSDTHKTPAYFRVISAETNSDKINDKFTMFNVAVQYQNNVLKGGVQIGENPRKYDTAANKLLDKDQWYDVELIYDLIGNNVHTLVKNKSTEAEIHNFDHTINWYSPFGTRELESLQTVMLKVADGVAISVDDFRLEYYLAKPEISPKDIAITDYKGIAQENTDAVSPAIGAIKIPFGTTMSEESTNENTVTLKDSMGNEVSYIPEYKHDAYIMNFSDSDWLGKDETYTLCIPETVENIFGESLGREVTYNFTTKMPEFMAIESVKIGEAEIAELSDITNGATIDINVEYSNTTQNEVDNMVSISYYNDDMLVYTQSVKGESIPVADMGLKKVSIIVPEDGVLNLAEVDRVSVCLWESNVNSIAYVDSFEIGNKPEEIDVESEEATVIYSYNESELSIQGKADKESKYVTVQILKPGSSFENCADEMVLYRGQNRVIDGAYSVNIRFDEKQNTESTLQSGVYPARVFVDDTKLDIDEVYINSYPDFIGACKALSDAASDNNFEEFKRIINEEGQKLNLIAEFTQGDNLSDELSEYYEYIKENPLSADNEAENIRIFKTYVAIDYLNKGKLDSVKKYANGLVLDEEVKGLCEELLYDGEIDSHLKNLISGKNIDGFSELEEEIKEGLILTAALYGNGYGDLKKVLEVCGDIINISKPVSVSACKALMGKEFENGNEFKDAYKKNMSSNSGGGGGGGGGSSSGGSAGNKGAVSSAPVKLETVETVEIVPVKKEFNDIDNYEWATESILGLADKGIINGVSENKFAPSITVSREEFAKIIVGALNMSEFEYGENIFKDANDGEWFTPYVNIAADLGVANGIGNGYFGVGQNIRRQDMAVMIYNALLYRGVNMAYGELHFEDSSEIAPYAKNAVSALYNMGAINGVSETTFAPNNFATRAEAAKMVYRVLGQLQG